MSTQISNKTKNSTLLASPALSQISRDGFTAFTPAQNKLANKKTSTPFMEKLKQADNKKVQQNENLALNEIQNFGMKRKRRLDDLFGDIYDIDEEEFDMKKQKTDEEKDMDTIEKILEARKVLETQMFPLKSNHIDRNIALNQFKKENLSKTIPKFPFITLTKESDDERIFVRCHSEDFEKMKLNEIKAVSGNFYTHANKEAMWKEANDMILSDAEKIANQEQQINQIIEFKSGDLLVDKYRPKKYIDLLSDESINRSLLQWIKLYDKVVFNREIVKKNAKPGELSNFNKKTGRFEQNGGWQRKRFRGNLNTDLDEHGCPIQKIALLVGPPGLAKTTLAHVIAKHAGYAVIERNASDDRQVESFRQTLENCTQMTSVLNTENRPNCIILDEIDGAPAPSIEFLVRFATGQISEKGKKGTKGKKKFILKRPIICICNDLYGANLRQLRQIAFVVNFQSIDSARLAERLLHIANREHIKTDLTALLTMVEKSGGDIRSCLSMLQFYASKKQPLTLFDVLNSNIGQKDQHKSLFTAWNSIFQIQRPKKIIKNSESNGRVISNSDMSIRTRMANVLDTISSCGEYEKLAQGVHENFLKQKIHDNIDGIVEACNWFSFNDRVQHKINSLQNYVMYPYLPYAFVSWHFIFASLTYPQISYPQKQYEVSQKLITVKQIFNSLKKGIANASLKGIGSGSEIITDTICLLKIIINPEIRSVSMHLLSEREKNELQHTVEIIADFGLSLIQLQAGDGTYTYRLEPDIEFFHFTGMPQKQISYWSKQMIANEVEVEKIRRAKPKVEANESVHAVEKKDDKKNSPTNENKKLPNHLQRLIPKSVKSTKNAQVVCKDFFGRIITKPSAAAGGSSSSTNDCKKLNYFYI